MLLHSSLNIHYCYCQKQGVRPSTVILSIVIHPPIFMLGLPASFLCISCDNEACVMLTFSGSPQRDEQPPHAASTWNGSCLNTLLICAKRRSSSQICSAGIITWPSNLTQRFNPKPELEWLIFIALHKCGVYKIHSPWRARGIDISQERPVLYTAV